MKWIINLMRSVFLIGALFEIYQMNVIAIILLIGSCLLTFIPEIYTKWTKVSIPIEACFFYNVFIFAAQFLGTYLGAYTFFSWWDIMLHLVSGVMIGYVALIILITVMRSPTIFQKKYALVVALFIFTVGATGAVIWEIIEFSGDTFLGTNAQLGSLQDTMEDLICGTGVGGLFALYIWWVMHTERKALIYKLLKCNFKRETEIENVKEISLKME